jgi:hypothetical protein
MVAMDKIAYLVKLATIFFLEETGSMGAMETIL